MHSKKILIYGIACAAASALFNLGTPYLQVALLHSSGPGTEAISGLVGILVTTFGQLLPVIGAGLIGAGVVVRYLETTGNGGGAWREPATEAVEDSKREDREH